MGTHTVFQCDVCGVERRTSDFFQTPEEWTYVTCDSGRAEEHLQSVDETAVASEILTILNNAVRAGAGRELLGATISIDDGTVTTRTGTYRITASRA